jgi:hypothetical protein
MHDGNLLKMNVLLIALPQFGHILSYIGAAYIGAALLHVGGNKKQTIALFKLDGSKTLLMSKLFHLGY